MKTLFIENTSSMADGDGNYHVFKHVQMTDDWSGGQTRADASEEADSNDIRAVDASA